MLRVVIGLRELIIAAAFLCCRVLMWWGGRHCADLTGGAPRRLVAAEDGLPGSPGSMRRCCSTRATASRCCGGRMARPSGQAARSHLPWCRLAAGDHRRRRSPSFWIAAAGRPSSCWSSAGPVGDGGHRRPIRSPSRARPEGSGAGGPRTATLSYPGEDQLPPRMVSTRPARQPEDPILYLTAVAV